SHVPRVILFFAFFGVFLFTSPSELIFWLFGLILLLGLPGMLKEARILVAGEVLTFNGVTREVLRNQGRITVFDDIANLQLIKQEYNRKLSAILKTERSVEIATSRAYDRDLVHLAEEIADILNIVVITGKDPELLVEQLDRLEAHPIALDLNEL